MDAPTTDVDDEKHIVADQPKATRYFDREEVGTCNRTKVRLDERAPTCMAPSFRRGLDSDFLEDGLDRVLCENSVEPNLLLLFPTPSRVTRLKCSLGCLDGSDQ